MVFVVVAIAVAVGVVVDIAVVIVAVAIAVFVVVALPFFVGRKPTGDYKFSLTKYYQQQHPQQRQ